MNEFQTRLRKTTDRSAASQSNVDSIHSLISNTHLLHKTIGNQAVQRMVKNVVSGASSEVYIQRLMTNVEFDDVTNPLNPTISKVSIERGEGTTGGAHSTAFVVFEDAAIHAVHGKSFQTAIIALLDLCDAIRELPNYKKAGATEQGQIDAAITNISNNNDYSNPGTVSDLRKGSVVQNLIKEYILLRNSLSNTLIPKTSGTKGKGSKNEKTGANNMSSANDSFGRAEKNTGGKFTKQFQSGLWQTFDERILPEYDTKTIKSEYLNKVAQQLANHLMSCIQAYPEIPDDVREKSSQFLATKAILHLSRIYSMFHLSTYAEKSLFDKIQAYFK